jgi:NAD-dependent SIR2 family protein deacetylase
VRCAACDKILNNYELTKKYAGSQQFVDLCNECSKYVVEDDVVIEGNINFASLSDLEEENYVEDRTMDYYTGTEYGDDEV